MSEPEPSCSGCIVSILVASACWVLIAWTVLTAVCK